MIRALILLTMISIFKPNLAIASSDKCDDGLLVVASGEAYRGGPAFSVTVRHEAGSWFSDVIEVKSARDIEFNTPYRPDEEPDWEEICVDIKENINTVNEMGIYFGDEKAMEFDADGEVSNYIGDRNLFIKSVTFQGRTLESNLGTQQPGCNRGKGIQDRPDRLYCAGELTLDWTKSKQVADNTQQQSGKSEPKEKWKEWLDNYRVGTTGSGKTGKKAEAKNNKAVVKARQFSDSENLNIKKIRNMDYDYKQMLIAEDIIRKLDDKSNELEIYDGYLFQPPKNVGKQISDATLEYYYLMTVKRPETRPNEYYIVKGSNNYKEFKTSFNTHKKITEQITDKTIISFIYYSNGEVAYDVLPPKNRFITLFNEDSYFPSHSIGKSITSYLMGYAICNGYIESIDDAISDWPLMENTLYYGQPIINLLNMSAGDTNVIEEKAVSFIKSGAGIFSKSLIDAVENENELKNTKPAKNASYSYSNLTSNVLMNYIAHRVGDKFDAFLSEFYQKKIGIKYPVKLTLNRLQDNAQSSIKNFTAQGAWRYGILATRYDYLRIAIAIMEDWKNDTCEGEYLKQIYKRAVTKGKKANWKQYRDGGNPGFESAASKYAGQFHSSISGMNDKNILVMSGADGQQIVINLDDERIIVISAGQEGWYNTKRIAYDLIKSGKMKSGNWN